MIDYQQGVGEIGGSSVSKCTSSFSNFNNGERYEKDFMFRVSTILKIGDKSFPEVMV